MKFTIAKTTGEIKTCYELRKIIFIKGQNVPSEEERDLNDNTATHFLLYDNTDKPIGVARIVTEDNIAVVGRLGILEEIRGNGAGLFLMENILQYCRKQEFKQINLGAQEHAINFYKKLNFEIISERYMDANIPHFEMKLEI